MNGIVAMSGIVSMSGIPQRPKVNSWGAGPAPPFPCVIAQRTKSK
jgi:hypothetical protein